MKNLIMYKTKHRNEELQKLCKWLPSHNVNMQFTDEVASCDIALIELDGEDNPSAIFRSFRGKNEKVRLIAAVSSRSFEVVKGCIKESVSYVLLPLYQIDEIKTAVKKCLQELFLLSENKFEKVGYSNLVNKSLMYIRENYNKGITLKEMAEDLSVSNWHLCKMLKSETGESFVEIMTNLRIKKSKELLENTTLKLCEVSSYIGISELTYFINLFKKRVGMSPACYREKYAK